MAVKLNQHDLQFILDQIKMAEAHVAGTPLVNLIDQPHLPYGLRTVDGSYNNLIPGRELWGASDQIMPRLLSPNGVPASEYNNEEDEGSIDINGPVAPGGVVTNTDYGTSGDVLDSDPRTITNLIVDQTLKNPAAIIAALQHAEYEGDLLAAVSAIRAQYQAYVNAAGTAAQAAIDAISTNVPAPTAADKMAAAAAAIADPAVAGLKTTLHETLVNDYGIEMDGNNVALPNVAPDEGLSAPFNGWMTFFGQFFDHGLDLIHKGDNGTIWVPLAADDPLRTHGPDGIANSGDEVPPHLAFMALTRLKPEAGPGADGILGDDPATVGMNEGADDTMEARNKTTPFVDQNQTYTSHPSHQVFLREYVMVDGKPMATGRLLNGVDGGLATWGDVKQQAEEKLGIVLSDIDVLGVPLLRTDPYGEFIRGADGFPQIIYNIGPDLVPNTEDDLTVSATPGNPIVLADINDGLGPVRTSHQFLDDIAHNANPIGTINGQPAILQPDINTDTDPLGNPIPNNPDLAPAYDNELLDKHFITGDGRGNENIGLTTVHHVFHSEHNRQVEDVKKQILDLAASGKQADIDFLNEWLLEPVAVGFDPATLSWDGERLFQTARFATEMQYQHLVFEEFGRKVQPNIDLFVFNTITDVNPAIFAEFAHTVYRFGHSMLTDTLKLLPLNADGQPVDANGNPVAAADWGVDVGLIEAFLNPVLFDNDGGISAEQAAGAIARGLNYVHGNAIDEFVVDALRNNLLGLPLDLAAINLARGRDAGIPTLNEAREQLYAASNSTWLKPYDSWSDFAANLKTPASIINFIAAYGTHPLILAADTLEEKRDAAMSLLGLGSSTATEGVSVTNASFDADSLASGAAGVIDSPLGNYTTSAPSGWELSGTGGLFSPAAGIVDPAGLTGPNVAWLGLDGQLTKDTGHVLEAGVSYRLTLDIGDRTDTVWPGGVARLVSADGTVLGTLVLSEPVNGTWSTVTLETGPIAAGLAGQSVSIEIEQAGGAGQILVEDVRLDAVASAIEVADRFDFLNGTGLWSAVETGYNLIDLWIGGLAERVMPFGGMLGSTFNAVFELQMENLQEGDRFYYLTRTQGLNLLNELENNAFSKLIMANTDIVSAGVDGIRGTDDDVVTHHIGVDSFAKYDGVLEVNQLAQIAADNAWGANDPFLEALRAKVQRDDPTTSAVETNYLRFTGGEHMVMGGTENADTIIGHDGDDGIWGGAGDDRIEGGHGVDLVIGGAGDDIITDSGDTGDFLKGESGDDVIANSNGLDILMGGDGKDVFLLGVDATEIFGGEGDDFALGGLDHDFMLGNEGDDWLEGGDGFDVLNGDNSELFFNSTILGHDVLIAGENENDFDAESGDDIMVQGESVMRNEGMFGFDWAIYKGSAVAADADMRIPFFTTVADDILRDRFDQTEALSGWDHNDILRGDDRGQNEEIEVELQLEENHFLSQAGVNRIDGLRDLLGLAEYTPPNDDVDLEKEVAWTAGNLLIGGDGSDLLEGRGGDDFIHGDAWLNVRIRITGTTVDGDRTVGLPNIAANEIATVDTLKHVFQAGEVDSDGQVIPEAWHGKSLSELLLARVIKPSQLHIVREIKYDEDPSDDTDTAIFAGNRDWYEITHLDDGSVRVARREMEEIDPQVSEGIDTLYGIERILFADGIYTVRQTGNYDPTGRLSINGLPAREDMPLTVNADAIRDLNNPDGAVESGSITFRWQIERNDGTGDYIDIPGASGNSFTPSDDHIGLRIRVLGTYHDAGGVIEVVSSQPTDVVLGENDEPTGPVLISDMTPTEGMELTATAAFDDPDGITDAFEEGLLTYQWQYLVGSEWTDAAGGNARSFTPGPAQVGHQMRMVITYTDDGGTEQTVISATTGIVGNYIVSDAAIPVDDEGGTNDGDDWVIGGNAANTTDGGLGNDILNGGGGNDSLTGDAGNDVIDGGAGDDIIDAGIGNDRVIHANGAGADIIDGGEGNDVFHVDGASPLSNDAIQIVMAAGIVSEIGGAGVSNFEAYEAEAGGGTDTLTYESADNVTVNLLSGAATGMSFTRGFENVTSGGGNDSLTGNVQANVLDGRGGSDELRGGFGNDDLRGGDGNDSLYGEQGDDLLEGGAGDDRIDGGVGDNDTASYASATGPVTVSLLGAPGKAPFEEQDTVGAGVDRLVAIENLTGSAHGDTLTGDAGANVIDGGAGADTMAGGAGDDTYVVDNAGDMADEATDAGTDTVRSSLASYTLGANIENLVLVDGASSGTGNTLDNELTGNAGNDTLDGGEGTDTVVLDGSLGDYTFARLNNGNITVTSVAGGTDTLVSVERVNIGGATYTIAAGTNLADTVAGGETADLVLGFNGSDELLGNGGDDILDGGFGADVMRGGAGNDAYRVQQGGDQIVEEAGGGVDTIYSDVSRNLNNANQAIGEIENVVLLGATGTETLNALGNGIDNVLTGNDGANTLTGNAGNDTLIGNVGNDTLNGDAANGNGTGNDILDGGAGDDALNGGGGTDTAVFAGPAGNYAFGSVGGNMTVSDLVGNGGTDTLNDIERLQFGDGPVLDIASVADGVPEGPAIIFGTDGDDTIIGGSGDDVIIGGLGNDTLNGYEVGTADDDVVPEQNDDDTFIWNANESGPTDGLDVINGGGEGAEGDLFQIVGNSQSEIFRIYTETEAVARGFVIQGEEPEIFVTRQVRNSDDTLGTEEVIAEIKEIEEIVINGNGVSGNASVGNGDTVEMYGDFAVTTSLRPDTITIIGSDGNDTVNISSLLSAHRIVFKTKGGNDTIIGTLRPEDVVELEKGRTIADYELVRNDDGSTTIASDTHSVTFRSTGGLPEFQAPGNNSEDDEDEDTDTPPVDNGGGDNSNDDHDDDDEDDDDDDNDDDGGTVTPPVDPVDEQPGTNPSGPKVGTPETDVLIGDGGDDSITGFAGDDVLIGYAGNDIILGGNGNDFIAGWDGKDIIWGGTGNDTAFGGSGNDAIEGEDGDDRLFGEAGDDMITAGNGNDTVVGGEGNDWLIAGNGDGNDVYFGDEINDASGTPHSDTLDMSTVTANTKVDLGTALGGMGSATSSQTGTDTLWGIENVVTGSGNDTIRASASVNVMDGGSGNDTFVFSSAAQANGDTIVGFETGDKIDLSGIDANGGASGNQPFTLVSNGAITAPAQIAVTQETIDGQDYTVISGNTAGNDNAEFKIKIEGSHDLTTSNFIL